MTTSILTSTKKMVGLTEDDESFDLDIITHINSVFSTLNQLGIGPDAGFMIEDKTALWSEFTDMEDPRYNAVKSYVYLRVRLLFDPPQTSFGIEAQRQQVTELEWRLNVLREGEKWTDPNPNPIPIPEVIW